MYPAKEDAHAIADQNRIGDYSERELLVNHVRSYMAGLRPPQVVPCGGQTETSCV